jgi:hypothetical protein
MNAKDDINPDIPPNTPSYPAEALVVRLEVPEGVDLVLIINGVRFDLD